MRRLYNILLDDLVGSGWAQPLQHVIESPSFIGFIEALDDLYKERDIYPRKVDILRAFKLCPYNKTKVVIVGQDPYYTKNTATGIAFGVASKGVHPPTLRNIFRELQQNIMCDIPPYGGSLEGWAEQGVLLMNTALTVEAGSPGSHKDKGWEEFTNEVIRVLSQDLNSPNIFLLWGKHAQSVKAVMKDPRRMVVLEAGHPSPQSVKTFMGCKHFNEANHWLRKYGKTEIDWSRINVGAIPYGNLIRESWN